jgi:hypothetical protein
MSAPVNMPEITAFNLSAFFNEIAKKKNEKKVKSIDNISVVKRTVFIARTGDRVIKKQATTAWLFP